MREAVGKIVASISHLSRTLDNFIRYGHAYRKALYPAIFLLVLVFCVGLLFLFPKADSASIRNGLTLVGEILGALLGALLVIISRLVQQREQAEELLRNAYPKYHKLVASQSDKVKIAFDDLLRCAEGGKINLTEGIYDGHGREEPKYRDVLGNLLALSSSIDRLSLDGAEGKLRELGFPQKEIEDFLYSKAVLARIDPPIFLRLVKDGLNYAAIAPWCSEPATEFAGNVFEGFSRDGVDDALALFERSRMVLSSKLLAINMMLVTSSTIAAIMGIFGTPNNADIIPSYYWAVAVMIGFLISVIMSLALVEKILT
jgi:hypothetical protein